MKQKLPTIEIDRFPIWAWVLTAYCFFLQSFFYLVTEIFVQRSGLDIQRFIPKISAIDDRIPLIPGFILVYWYSFIFWIGATLRIAHTDKQHFTNWVIAFTVSELIGFLIFCVYPTTMDRYQEGLFSLATKNDFFSHLLWLTYTFDGGRWGCNLFPSYHCMFSMSCYMGIRKHKNVTLPVRIYTFISIILIFMSTLFTKQHYFTDVISGVAISIICNIVVEKINPGKRFRPKIMDEPEFQHIIGGE